jgi:protein-tyrosine phosphatase
VSTPDYSLAGDLSALGRHPHDEDVWLGGYKALRQPPAGVTAVVSVCPVAAGEVPAGVEQIDVPLVDSPYAADNPNLALVLHDTADLIQTLRGEGRIVLVHGVQGASRVPAVAGAYAFRHYDLTVSGAFTDVRSVLRRAQLNEAFRDALEALAPVPETSLAPRPLGVRSRAESERPTRWNSIDGWPEGRTLNRRNR